MQLSCTLFPGVALLGHEQAVSLEEGVEEEEGGCQAPQLEVVGQMESEVQGRALAPALARSELEFPAGVFQDIQVQGPCQM